MWRQVNQGEGRTVDDELVSKQVQVERKTFSFTLKQNPRGRFLRITEDVNGHRDTVIIPSTGLSEVRTVIDQMIAADQTAGDAPPAAQL